MKTIILGDTHGRTDWATIVADQEFDKIVFIGDYFDSHEDISGRIQIDNFCNIVSYKEDNPGKVVLLTGNHDYHYLKGVTETYSSYQPVFHSEIQAHLEDAISKGLMQMCYVKDNMLCSHAGVTKTWYNEMRKKLGIAHPEDTSICHYINDAFKFKIRLFSFDANAGIISRYRDPYGDEITQSPIWVRPKSLRQDKLDDYIQVVGHTTQDKIRLGEDIILIDTLGTSGEYLIYENKEFSIGKI